MPAQALREKQHPAKRSFQAIRIAVNDELGAVSRMMQDCGRAASSPADRLAVITFHSLEDRIVKSEMQQAAQRLHLPAEFPGLRLRQQAEDRGPDPETHHRDPRRGRRKSAFPQRKAARGGKVIKGAKRHG